MQNKVITKQEQWFTDRIGKRVYRKQGSCKCKSCFRLLLKQPLTQFLKNVAEFWK